LYSRAAIILKRGLLQKLIVGLASGTAAEVVQAYFAEGQLLEAQEKEEELNFCGFDQELYDSLFEIGLWEDSQRHTYRSNFYYRPELNFYASSEP
jgi:hypothetical protein